MGTQARDVVAEAVDDSAPAGTNTDHVTDSILAALSEAGFVVVPTSGEGDFVGSDRGFIVAREVGDRIAVRVEHQAGASAVVYITPDEAVELAGILANEVARIAFRSALTPGGETP